MRQDRRVRAARPPVRADRDGAHRRDRDLARAQRDLSAIAGDRAPSPPAARSRSTLADLASARRRASSSGRRRCAAPARAARRAGQRHAVELAHRVDPRASCCASRRPGEPWFCLEQPDRDGCALAALGAVRALEAAGADRFERGRAPLARARARRGRRRRPAGRRGRGWSRSAASRSPPTAAASPRWHGFAPASLVVPEVVARPRAAAERVADR